MNEISDLTSAIKDLTALIEDALEIKDLRTALSDLACKIEKENDGGFEMKEKHIPLLDGSYEKTLLGGLMLDNSKIDAVLATGILPCHFEKIVYQKIFKAIMDLHFANKSFCALELGDKAAEEWSSDYNCYSRHAFDLAHKVSDKAIPHLQSIANVIWSNAQNRITSKK